MLPEITVFSTLFGFLLAGLWGRSMGTSLTHFVTILAMLIATVGSVVLFVDVALRGNPFLLELAPWIIVGDFSVSWALRFDTLSTVMLVVITLVALMVHIYSVAYMAQDASRQRFMAYLNLFVFCMIMLVTADNFLQLFFGWEGVGLASYLLIGFWHEKPSANAAAMKAFVVNRVGDLGLALGIFGVYQVFGSLQFDAVFDAVDSTPNPLFGGVPMFDVLAILLFVGAVGKSAQLGLHVWLPDAMEGPTPVSALIHAATMVTAGVFLMCRVSPLLAEAPLAADIVLLVGAATAFFAATVGMTQFDIKRVIAYSTCSQLGYMMMAVGVGAYGAAMFHLFTHAFFKALLFLGAGSVIHAFSHEQDMRFMGGVRSLIPWTYRAMLVGSLALAGIVPFAGHYSKDIILESLYAAPSLWGVHTYIVGVLVAFMTAFYSWRLLFLTFHGKPRADERVMARVHESPWAMMVPLFLLSLAAIGAGYAAYHLFVGEERITFWSDSLAGMGEQDVIAAAHHVAHTMPLVKWLPLVAALSGIALSWLFYRYHPGWRRALVRRLGLLHRFVFQKWYVDELYHVLFVCPARWLGSIFGHYGDKKGFDQIGPHAGANISRFMGGVLVRVQSGLLSRYAMAIFAGITVMLFFIIAIRIR